MNFRNLWFFENKINLLLKFLSEIVQFESVVGDADSANKKQFEENNFKDIRVFVLRFSFFIKIFRLILKAFIEKNNFSLLEHQVYRGWNFPGTEFSSNEQESFQVSLIILFLSCFLHVENFTN